MGDKFLQSWNNKNEKVQITYIIDELQIGGTEKQLIATINKLDRTKFQPYLVFLRESDFNLLRLVDCPKIKISLYSFKSWKAVVALIKLVNFLRKQRIDIVQTFFIDSTLFGVVAAKLAGVQYVISSRRDLGFWSNKIISQGLRAVNPFISRFLVNSLAVKNYLIKYEKIPASKIDVIYNGIDLAKYFKNPFQISRNKLFPQIGLDSTIVGIVANLNRKVKRVDLFIKAAAIVSKNWKNVYFVIIGDGYLRPSLEIIAKNLNIFDKVVFMGIKKNVFSYIKHFDIGVISSDSEGFSNTILEYMAAGIPTIATDVGGNNEIIEDGVNGFLVPKNNAEMMADRILMLLKNEKLRKKMGKKAKQKVKLFSWDLKIKEIQNYYLSLVNRKFVE